jgi:hypothetical protein
MILKQGGNLTVSVHGVKDHGHNALARYKGCEFNLEFKGTQEFPFPTKETALGLKGAFQDPDSLLRSLCSNLLQ